MISIIIMLIGEPSDHVQFEVSVAVEQIQPLIFYDAQGSASPTRVSGILQHGVPTRLCFRVYKFFSLRNTERMKGLFLFLSSSTSVVLFSLNESLFCRKYLIDSSRKEERGEGRIRGRSDLTVHISCFQTWLSNPGVLQRQGGPGPPQSYWIRNFRGQSQAMHIIGAHKSPLCSQIWEPLQSLWIFPCPLHGPGWGLSFSKTPVSINC